MRKITFVTGNSGKAASAKKRLSGVATVEQKKLELTEIQGSIEEVCRAKLLEAHALLGHPVLCEDGGIELEFLPSGLPGAYTKEFVGGLRGDALEYMLDFIVRNAHDVSNVRGVAHPKATFVNCTGYIGEDGIPHVFTDRLTGVVASEVAEDTCSEFSYSPLSRIIALDCLGGKVMCTVGVDDYHAGIESSSTRWKDLIAFWQSENAC